MNEAMDESGNELADESEELADESEESGESEKAGESEETQIPEERNSQEESVKSKLQAYIEENRTDTEVKVAVIDTGLDKTTAEYEQIQERIPDTGLNLSTSGEKGDIQDDNGHGTSMISIIAGMTGENIKLLPIKAANACGQSTVLSTYLALQSAMELQADVVLISMNGRSGSAPLLKEMIEQASEQGILVVVSAGNYHMDTSGSAPADVEKALVISAVEEGNTAEYSNFGQTVDFCADGSYNFQDMEGNIMESHGTSYAAARAAAMAASLRTFLADRTEVEEALLAYAQDMGDAGFDEFYGNGYLGEKQIVEAQSEETETDDRTENTGEENQGSTEDTDKTGNTDKTEETDEAEEMDEASGASKEWIRNEGDVLSTSADKPSPGHHYETKYHKPASNKLKTHETLYDIDNGKNDDEKACGCIGGYTDAEIWEYGHACNDANSWRFTIYTHIHGDGSSYQWTETIRYNSNGSVTIVASSLDVSAAKTDRTNYLKGDGKNASSCSGYQEEVANTYTIAYNTGGGTTIANGSVIYDKGTTVNATTPTKTGYTFDYYYLKRTDGKVWGGDTNGWVKASETSKLKKYQPGDEITFDEKIGGSSKDGDTFTFVAMWKKNTYTIAYNKNGGTGSMSSTSVEYGEKFTIAKNGFTRTGHTFKGYYVKRKSDSKWYCESTNKWQSAADIKDNSYTKTLFTDTDKESTMNTTWIRSDQGADTFTFYAVWEVNSYTVTYNANGNVKGTIKGKKDSTTTAKVTYGKEIPLGKKAVPKDDYYTFVGWSTSKTGEPLSSLKMGAKNITLYAVYSPPVSDIDKVYLQIKDSGGTSSKNGKEIETKYLSKTADVSKPLGYTYSLDKLSYKKLFPKAKLENIYATLYAVDHAGNSKKLKTYNGYVPPLFSYEQTVVHKFQNLDTGEYDEKGIIIEEPVLEGNTYIPRALSPLPAGYEGYKLNSTKSKGIGKAYTVTENKTIYAYYDAIPYTLTFDPNGGAIDDKNWVIDDKGMTSKTVYTGKPYGYLPGGKLAEFPTVTKERHSFTGWYTTSDNSGTKVSPTTIYELAADSTIYAHWKENEYTVTYDYLTNGGTSASKTTAKVKYGEAVDLTVTAEKEGWEFVGWNTDSNATTGISSCTMPAEDITLYAIYKKDITATYIDRNDAGIQTRSETKTIFNLDEEISITLPEQNVWNGWETEGWCATEDATGEQPDAETLPTDIADTSRDINENTTFYGRYSKNVTVSYDTNGSLQVIEPDKKTRYYNASDSYQNPEFILAEGLEKELSSFDKWVAPDGREFEKGETVKFTEDILLTAKWDEYPVPVPQNRFFSLAAAKNGAITEVELLKTVVATDTEDGTLEVRTASEVVAKGEKGSVFLINFDPIVFTSLTDYRSEIKVYYRAVDSFGNMVEASATVVVQDTTAVPQETTSYVRYINKKYYEKSYEEGGLHPNSVWRTNPEYKAAIEQAFDNLENDTPVYTIHLTHEDVLAIQDDITEHGIGKEQEEDALINRYNNLIKDKIEY